MKSRANDYSDYAEHPRYGRGPNLTGLNPDPLTPEIQLHWNATNLSEIAARYEMLTGKKWPHEKLAEYNRAAKRIPGTAIPADLTRQTAAMVAVTHYFDVDRVCVDCDRKFIFFAAEQKYWYEELGFGLESDCVRCVDCRKRQQGQAQKVQRYEELFHEPARTDAQNLEMAECCLALMESSIFGRRQTQRVRMLLKKIANAADPTVQLRRDDLFARVRELETEGPAERLNAEGIRRPLR
jgi:hypothetical protein